jgi:hypothetical protein
MRRPLVTTLAALAAAVVAPAHVVCAQEATLARLVDTIERPIAYLCLEAMAPTEAGAVATRSAGPVQRLLADPAFGALLTGGDAAASGAARAMELVLGLLSRSTGELELVLTGVVPGAGQPLLVLRARLQRGQADNLQLALDGEDLAAPMRRVGGRQTFKLRSASPAAGPGQEVELALVGADLLVGNDTRAITEVLDPPPPTTAATQRRAVLTADERFQAMRQRLPVGPGALWIYGDWQRLGQRLAESLEGVPGWLLGSSGLGDANAVMASVAGERADLAATLLLGFAPPAPEAQKRRGPRIPSRRGLSERRDGPFRGWFDAVELVAARTLQADLPAGGFGGIVLSVDLAEIAARSHGGGRLLHDLHHAFGEYGLDLERNVLGRLGSRGTVQLQVGPGEGSGRVAAIYSMRTKNKKAAADLFADLRRVAEPAGLGKVIALEGRDPGRERRAVELLRLRAATPPERDVPPDAGGPMFVAAHEDALLFADDADTLAGHVDELRRGGKPRARRGDHAIAAIAGENVAGLFDLDLQPLFERLTSALTGAATKLDLSSLPRRHVGYLDLQHHGDDTIVRVRVLSSR